MKTSYKRELDHNWLVLEQEEYQENYQVGMLLKNKIPGFLECRLSRFDRGVFFYYIAQRAVFQSPARASSTVQALSSGRTSSTMSPGSSTRSGAWAATASSSSLWFSP